MRGRHVVRIVAVVAAVAAPGCWLQTGFDAGRTGFNDSESAITAANVAGLTQAWSVSTGFTEPLVQGGAVYSRGPNVVVALDAATGATRWSVPATGSLPPTAALAGDRLWVPLSTGGDNDCRLLALDPVTGATVQSVHVPTPGPGPAPGIQVFCELGDLVTDGTTVTVEWGFEGEGQGIHDACSPLPDVASGTGALSIDAKTGATVWAANDVVAGCGGLPPPDLPFFLSARGSTTYSVRNDHITTYTANGACGQAVCEGSLPLPTGPGGVARYSTATGDGHLLLGATDGRLLVLDATTGALDWTGDLGSTSAPAFAATPTTVYATGSGGRVAAFPLGGCGADTCTPTWTSTTPTGAVGTPAVGGDVLYVSDRGGGISAWDAAGCGAASCTPRWTGSLGGPGSGGPVVDDGTLYVGSQGTGLTAFRLGSS